MITIVMSTLVEAPPERVWRALTAPAELVAWNQEMLAPVETPTGYPFSGQHVRWRYRLGGVQLVMHDRPLEVLPQEKLRSAITIGSMRYEQTFTLAPEGQPSLRTRLGMKVVASNSIPVVGDVVDRFTVRRMAAERVDMTLKALQQWCESRG